MTREEMIAKARTAKTPEELLQMAHEIGMTDFTEENAKAYFDILQKSGENKIDGKKSGELADEELDVSAGGCKKDGNLVVTKGNVCSRYSEHTINGYAFERWKCKTCKEEPGAKVATSWSMVRKTCSCNRSTVDDFSYAFGVCANFNAVGVCGSCDWCKYVDGVWICTEPYI